MKKTLLSRSGMTMVSVIVAFTVIMIIFASFTMTVTLSNGMVRKAEETKAETESFIEAYYTEISEKTTVPGGLTMTAPNGDSFSLDSVLTSRSDGEGNVFYSFSPRE